MTRLGIWPGLAVVDNGNTAGSSVRAAMEDEAGGVSWCGAGDCIASSSAHGGVCDMVKIPQ
jgi:hypothetical protein